MTANKCVEFMPSYSYQRITRAFFELVCISVYKHWRKNITVILQLKSPLLNIIVMIILIVYTHWRYMRLNELTNQKKLNIIHRMVIYSYSSYKTEHTWTTFHIIPVTDIVSSTWPGALGVFG